MIFFMFWRKMSSVPKIWMGRNDFPFTTHTLLVGRHGDAILLHISITLVTSVWCQNFNCSNLLSVLGTWDPISKFFSQQNKSHTVHWCSSWCLLMDPSETKCEEKFKLTVKWLVYWNYVRQRNIAKNIRGIFINFMFYLSCKENQRCQISWQTVEPEWLVLMSYKGHFKSCLSQRIAKQ